MHDHSGPEESSHLDALECLESPQVNNAGSFRAEEDLDKNAGRTLDRINVDVMNTNDQADDHASAAAAGDEALSLRNRNPESFSGSRGIDDIKESETEAAVVTVDLDLLTCIPSNQFEERPSAFSGGICGCRESGTGGSVADLCWCQENPISDIVDQECDNGATTNTEHEESDRDAVLECSRTILNLKIRKRRLCAFLVQWTNHVVLSGDLFTGSNLLRCYQQKCVHNALRSWRCYCTEKKRISMKRSELLAMKCRRLKSKTISLLSEIVLDSTHQKDVFGTLTARIQTRALTSLFKQLTDSVLYRSRLRSFGYHLGIKTSHQRILRYLAIWKASIALFKQHQAFTSHLTDHHRQKTLIIAFFGIKEFALYMKNIQMNLGMLNFSSQLRTCSSVHQFWRHRTVRLNHNSESVKIHRSKIELLVCRNVWHHWRHKSSWKKHGQFTAAESIARNRSNLCARILSCWKQLMVRKKLKKEQIRTFSHRIFVRAFCAWKTETCRRKIHFRYRSKHLERLQTATISRLKLWAQYSRNLVACRALFLKARWSMLISTCYSHWHSHSAFSACRRIMLDNNFRKKLSYKAFVAYKLHVSRKVFVNSEIHKSVMVMTKRLKAIAVASLQVNARHEFGLSIAIDHQRNAVLGYVRAALTAIKFRVTYKQYLSAAESIVTLRENKNRIGIAFFEWFLNSIAVNKDNSIDFTNDSAQIQPHTSLEDSLRSDQVSGQRNDLVDGWAADLSCVSVKDSACVESNSESSSHISRNQDAERAPRMKTGPVDIEKRKTAAFQMCIIRWRKIHLMRCIVVWESVVTVRKTVLAKACSVIGRKLKFVQKNFGFQRWYACVARKRLHSYCSARIESEARRIRLGNAMKRWQALHQHRLQQRIMIRLLEGKIYRKHQGHAFGEWRDYLLWNNFCSKSLSACFATRANKMSKTAFLSLVRDRQLEIEYRIRRFRSKILKITESNIFFKPIHHSAYIVWSQHSFQIHAIELKHGKSLVLFKKSVCMEWCAASNEAARIRRTIESLVPRRSILLRRSAIRVWHCFAESRRFISNHQEKTLAVCAAKTNGKKVLHSFQFWVSRTALSSMAKALIAKKANSTALVAFLDWEVNMQDERYLSRQKLIAVQYRTSHVLIECFSELHSLVLRRKSVEHFISSQKLRRKLETLIVWYLYLRIESLRLKKVNKVMFAVLSVWRAFCLFDKRISTMQYLAMIQNDERLLEWSLREWIHVFRHRRRLWSLYHHFKQAKDHIFLAAYGRAWIDLFQHKEYLALIERKVYLFVVASLLTRILQCWNVATKEYARLHSVFLKVYSQVSLLRKRSAFFRWEERIEKSKYYFDCVNAALMNRDRKLLALHMENFINVVIIGKTAMYFRLVIYVKFKRFIFAKWAEKSKHIRKICMQLDRSETNMKHASFLKWDQAFANQEQASAACIKKWIEWLESKNCHRSVHQLCFFPWAHVTAQERNMQSTPGFIPRLGAVAARNKQNSSSDLSEVNQSIELASAPLFLRYKFLDWKTYTVKKIFFDQALQRFMRWRLNLMCKQWFRVNIKLKLNAAGFSASLDFITSLERIMKANITKLSSRTLTCWKNISYQSNLQKADLLHHSSKVKTSKMLKAYIVWNRWMSVKQQLATVAFKLSCITQARSQRDIIEVWRTVPNHHANESSDVSGSFITKVEFQLVSPADVCPDTVKPDCYLYIAPDTELVRHSESANDWTAWSARKKKLADIAARLSCIHETKPFNTKASPSGTSPSGNGISSNFQVHFFCRLWIKIHMSLCAERAKQASLYLHLLSLSDHVCTLVVRRSVIEWMNDAIYCKMMEEFLVKFLSRRKKIRCSKFLQHWACWALEMKRRTSLNHLHKLHEKRLKDAVLSKWLAIELRTVRREGFVHQIQTKMSIRKLNISWSVWKARNDRRALSALASSIYTFQQVTRYFFMWHSEISQASCETGTRMQPATRRDTGAVWDRWEVINLDLQDAAGYKAQKSVDNQQPVTRNHSKVENLSGSERIRQSYLQDDLIVGAHDILISASIVCANGKELDRCRSPDIRMGASTLLKGDTERSIDELQNAELVSVEFARSHLSSDPAMQWESPLDHQPALARSESNLAVVDEDIYQEDMCSADVKQVEIMSQVDDESALLDVMQCVDIDITNEIDCSAQGEVEGFSVEHKMSIPFDEVCSPAMRRGVEMDNDGNQFQKDERNVFDRVESAQNLSSDREHNSLPRTVYFGMECFGAYLAKQDGSENKEAVQSRGIQEPMVEDLVPRPIFLVPNVCFVEKQQDPDLESLSLGADAMRSSEAHNICAPTNGILGRERRIEAVIELSSARRCQHAKQVAFFQWQEQALLMQQANLLIRRARGVIKYKVLVSWVRLHSAKTLLFVAETHSFKRSLSYSFHVWVDFLNSRAVQGEFQSGAQWLTEPAL